MEQILVQRLRMIPENYPEWTFINEDEEGNVIEDFNIAPEDSYPYYKVLCAMLRLHRVSHQPITQNVDSTKMTVLSAQDGSILVQDIKGLPSPSCMAAINIFLTHKDRYDKN